MVTFLIGGAASGKSALAERAALSLPGPHIYLATMRDAKDPETHRRIARHRAARAGLGFSTLERPADLANAPIPPGSNVLLEDLTNLLANEVYGPAGGGMAAVRRGLDALFARCRHVTVVGNDVFSGGADYSSGTLAFLRDLAALHRDLAARADTVIEAVCGRVNLLKGDVPW